MRIYTGRMNDLGEIPPESIRRLRRAEYDRMFALGMFEDERVELLDGILVAMNPQGAPHAEVIRRLTELFVPALLGRARVQMQLPVATSEFSEPEPDLALVPVADYSTDHPTAAFVVVEVADSSLGKDRRLKSRLYAQAGIPEYWIVDLRSRSIEVCRAPSGTIYSEVQRFQPGDTLHAAAFPDIQVDVAALIPLS